MASFLFSLQHHGCVPKTESVEPFDEDLVFQVLSEDVFEPAVSSGANLLSNPGFEALLAPWGAARLGRLTQAQSHSGAMSMLTPSGGTFSQTVSGLVANSTYTVSAFINGGTATLNVNGRRRMRAAAGGV